MTTSGPAPATEVTPGTVEEMVRARLSQALGGRRGMVEGALPTLVFTAVYLLGDALRPALVAGIAVAAVLVVARVVARQTVQFALNSLLVMAVAGFLAARSGRAQDVFLPGIVWNAVALALLLLSVVVRWPLIGVLIGSATGDLTSWRSSPAVVSLCTRLTLLFCVPNAVRLAVQLPLYLTGQVGWLATAKLALGWPLYLAVLAVMVSVLARGRTPLG